jgi:hypothetical protein
VKTSKKMQEVITRLAARHGLDLSAPEARLRLDMPGFDRLVIERTDEKLVSVAHYYEQDGRLIPDPRIVFFTGESDWIPMEITQVLGGHRICAVLSTHDQEVVLVNSLDQMSLALFAEDWAWNIESQGWLEHGEKWNPCDPAKAWSQGLETFGQPEHDEWHQPFLISSVCRANLRGILTEEEIAALSDDDMEDIADKMSDAHRDAGGYWEALEIFARLVLERKEEIDE